MYTLNVSHDCGMTYSPYRQEVAIDAFEPLLAALDAQGLRWFIEDDNGEPLGPMCERHRSIISFMEALNTAPEETER